MAFAFCFSFYAGLTSFAIAVVSPVVVYILLLGVSVFFPVLFTFFNVFFAKLILVFVVAFLLCLAMCWFRRFVDLFCCVELLFLMFDDYMCTGLVLQFFLVLL